MKDSKRLIAAYLKKPETWSTGRFSPDSTGQPAQNNDALLKEKLESFSLWGLISAGLLDGINPCAIATLVFLISFLAVRKRRRSEIVLIGLVYTATVYTTYLLMGIGALSIITGLIKSVIISKIIKWAVIAFALVVALLSLRDAIVYIRKGDARDMKVQLPKVLKLRIHKIISQNLVGTQLVFGTLIAGFLVTILEAVCTGQFYLPVLTAMAAKKDPKAVFYLMFYNFLFVLPLIIVMILAFFGMKWDKLAKTSQKSLAVLKVLLGVALLALCVYLYFTM
jgi:cytochrome c biogenesis protein CcdA